MGLADQINSDLKTAMLNSDKAATETLRMLKAAIIYTKAQDGSEEIEESELIKIIRKEVKKRNEAAESFRKAMSEERALQEEQEAKILEKYLPAPIDSSTVENYITELHSTKPELQKGEAIRQTLSHFRGQADGKTVSELISRIFS